MLSYACTSKTIHVYGFNVTVTHLPVIQWILKLHQ